MASILGWFSCGVTSAIACKMAVDKFGDDVDLWYLETGASHPDNARFIADCEKWYGKQIKTARSNKFLSPLDVARKELFNTPHGSPCTNYLKKEVRKKVEKNYFMPFSVFGFEYTVHEVNRALRWTEQHHKRVYFPLIEKRLTKEDCLLLLKKAKIELPAMYKLGYHNNNCIGCFKGGMGYWNKIRKDFPDVFEATAKLERETRHTCLKENETQLYLDNLNPKRGRNTDLHMPDCGLFCDLELEGLHVNKNIEKTRQYLIQLHPPKGE